MKSKAVIGVVGPCKSGKSTLVAGLRAEGYQPHHIAQEHSFVPDMWRKMTKPDCLIYLDVSYPLSKERGNLQFSEADFEEQRRRLAHARQHADLYVDTSPLSAAEVLEKALEFLTNQ